MTNENGKGTATDFDVVVVGAGFAGLVMLYRLRQIGVTARAYETGNGVGGTWFWNRYPGARCDVESMEYSYQFSPELQQEWNWTERYSAQPEILRYINHVADRFDLRRDIQLSTRVTTATYDEGNALWTVETDRGDRVTARFLVMATGCLSAANTPNFPGRDSFAGRSLHTGAWPQEGVDFTGKRVGIIGTGSSGIQSIPVIADECAHLTVFQRTPNFSVPAGNRPLTVAERDRVKAVYPEFRAANSLTPFGVNFDSTGISALAVSDDARVNEYEERWEKGGLRFLGAFVDLMFDRDANATAAEFVRDKIRSIVKDPEVAAMLTPKDVIGCKRLCSDTGYFEAFNRPNVKLVDVAADPIVEITKDGLRTQTRAFEFDTLVYATGFDAMTGALTRIDIRGKGGAKLADAWSAGPRTYLGVATVGFPNLFLVTGPGSPSVLSNMVPSVEQHAQWISSCIRDLRDRGTRSIEAQPDAQDSWVGHVNEVAGTTLYPQCNSWYLGSNVPGKPRVFMPYLGYATYVEKCNEVAANGYEGFTLG